VKIDGDATMLEFITFNREEISRGVERRSRRDRCRSR
jgi:hypothetical protein